jgi:hypothetical protein
MERLEVVPDPDPSAWNRRIGVLDGPLHLTTEWVRFVCAKGNVRPLFLQTHEGNDASVAVAYMANPRGLLSRWPVAYAECLPLATDRTAILDDLEVLLRSLRCAEFTVGSFAWPMSKPMALAPLGYAEMPRLEFVLGLDDGLDAAWMGMRPNMRNEIRRFEASGARCRWLDEREAVEALIAIDEETAQRHRAQGKSAMPMQRTSYELLSTEVLASQRARCYVAVREGTPIASAVVGRCGRHAYYLYGGATPAGLAINAPKGLLWFAIRQEFEFGVRCFNLGGMSTEAESPTSLDHGLYRFKSGFGAEKRVCVSGRKLFRPAVVDLQSKIRRLRSALALGWA